jgi:hypothetical protein
VIDLLQLLALFLVAGVAGVLIGASLHRDVDER